MSLRAKIRSILTLGRGVVRGLPDASADRDPLELFPEWVNAAAPAGPAVPGSPEFDVVDTTLPRRSAR